MYKVNKRRPNKILSALLTDALFEDALAENYMYTYTNICLLSTYICHASMKNNLLGLWYLRSVWRGFFLYNLKHS